MTTDLTTITEGTTDLVALFKGDGDQIDPIIARIEADVRGQVADLTTDKGRKAIASLAYKVSKSKTALDEAGKTLTDAQRKEIASVDAARKKIRDRLDALRDEVRKPLTDWEAVEDARKARITETLSDLRNHGITGTETPDAIRNAAECIKAIVIGADFGDAFAIATAAKEATLETLRGLYAAAQQRERDAAELAKLRADAEARQIADEMRAAQEAEAKWKADEAARVDAQRLADEKAAAEAKRIADERAEQARADAEKSAVALASKIEADKLAAAEAARAEAERMAEERRQEEAHRHAHELAEAKQREDRAAQAERDHIAAQAKAADDARARREADQAHRAKITSDIVAALQAMAGHATPDAIAAALIDGKIPHCKVSM